MELGCSGVRMQGARHGRMINYLEMGRERELNHMCGDVRPHAHVRTSDINTQVHARRRAPLTPQHQHLSRSKAAGRLHTFWNSKACSKSDKVVKSTWT